VIVTRGTQATNNTVGFSSRRTDAHAGEVAPRLATSPVWHNLLDVAVAARLQELSGEVYQVAQALILCGLPYRPSDRTKIIRKARLGDGSYVTITFVAALEASLPYGSDRSVLHFMLDRAVKSGSRFVSWETATEYLTAMGLKSGGKNRRDLRERFARIRGLTIGVERSHVTSDHQITPIVRRSRLPQSVAPHLADKDQSQCQLNGEINLGLEIDGDFFEELIQHHVPVPVEILRATRGKPQLQDMMLFLYWRCYAANSLSLISWSALLQQLWQDDTNRRRIRGRFVTAIRTLKAIWPQMQAEAKVTGLEVAPPLNGIYLTSQAGNSRRVSLRRRT